MRAHSASIGVGLATARTLRPAQRFQIEDLARHCYPVRGDGGGPAAGRLGIEGHLDFARARRGDRYQAEVAVEVETVVAGEPVVIGGRIDGVETTLFGDVVFEVKCLASPPADLAELEARFPHHALQLRIYGWALERVRSVHELRLVAMPFGPDGSPARARAREIVVPARDVGAEVELAVRSLLRHRARSLATRRRRRLMHLCAPHERWRNHQEEVLSFLDDHGRAVVLAATGSGKTAPVLYRALRRAAGEGKRLLWVTAKTLGQPPVMETARRMRERGAGLRALRVSAQDRLCSGALCPDVMVHRRNAYERDVWKEACRLGVVEEPDLKRLGADLGVCPRALQDELLPLFDLLVGDYNFVLDPAPGARNLTEGEGALVIDEAHNVYERVRDALSAGVSAVLAEEALALPEDQVRGLAAAFLDVRPRLPEQGEPSAYGELLPLAERAQRVMAGTAPDGAGRAFLDELGSLAWPLQDEIHPRRGFAGPDGVRLVSLDPAPFVGERLRNVDPLVLLTATLDPPTVHLPLVGLGDLPCCVVEDPFASQRRVLLVPAAGSRYAERTAEAPRAAEAIERMIDASPGRYLAFASSFDHAALIAAALRQRGTSVTLQERGMDRAHVADLARGFCADDRPGVLLAPAAGLLGEGIDLPPGLAGVFLLGPSLPALTDERRAIQAYHDARGADGFELAFLAPGLARVVQAAGRVVRRENEYGWIVLLDRRFAARRYRRLLPTAWQAVRPLSVADAVRVMAGEGWGEADW